MYIIGGRGGPLTVLLGLFIYLIIGLCYLTVYTIAGGVIILILAGKGIRALYRHRKAAKQVRTYRPPLPVRSPVEYHPRRDG